VSISDKICEDRESKIKQHANDQLHLRTSAIESRSKRELQEIRKQTECLEELKNNVFKMLKDIDSNVTVNEFEKYKSEVYNNFVTMAELTNVKEMLQKKASNTDFMSLFMEFD
jgi:hypothetical protein